MIFISNIAYSENILPVSLALDEAVKPPHSFSTPLTLISPTRGEKIWKEAPAFFTSVFLSLDGRG
jgi:hypothetical protein